MAKNNNLGDYLTDIANAIRQKEGSSSSINAQDFSSHISNLGVTLTCATPTLTLNGKTATATLPSAKIPNTIVNDYYTMAYVSGGTFNYNFTVDGVLKETNTTGTFNFEPYLSAYRTYTIGCYVSASKCQNSASVTQTYDYRYGAYLGKSLEDATWEEIETFSNELAELGANADTENVYAGAEKTISVNGTNYKFVVIGILHDNLTTPVSGRTKAGLTFQMQDSYSTTYKMNSTQTSSGGWGSSYMRSTVMPQMKGYLPSDLQSRIKQVHKPYCADRSSDTLSYSDDYCFLLSGKELYGIHYSAQGGNAFNRGNEGEQYEYYSTAQIPSGAGTGVFGSTGTWLGNGSSYTNRLGESKAASSDRYLNYQAARGIGAGSRTATQWWLRSCRYSMDGWFCRSESQGYIGGGNYANGSDAVSFAFCI